MVVTLKAETIEETLAVIDANDVEQAKSRGLNRCGLRTFIDLDFLLRNRYRKNFSIQCIGWIVHVRCFAQKKIHAYLRNTLFSPEKH